MKFEIFNHFSGAVQFVAEIDAQESDSRYVRIGMAVKWAYKTGARLDGARLDGARLVGASLDGANLDGASLVGARLVGASLVGASLDGASLDGASLDGASLDGASLDGASLDGASLDGARLVGASLVGASLDGARLGDQWIIQGATRSDGYAFFLQRLSNDKEPMVKAGCRYFTLAKAQTHWNDTRGGTQLGEETEIIVRSMVALMRARGLS